MAEFKCWYDQYGVWVILAKGLTPIPYKLVTIAWAWPPSASRCSSSPRSLTRVRPLLPGGLGGQEIRPDHDAGHRKAPGPVRGPPDRPACHRPHGEPLLGWKQRRSVRGMTIENLENKVSRIRATGP